MPAQVNETLARLRDRGRRQGFLTDNDLREALSRNEDLNDPEANTEALIEDIEASGVSVVPDAPAGSTLAGLRPSLWPRRCHRTGRRRADARRTRTGSGAGREYASLAAAGRQSVASDASGSGDRAVQAGSRSPAQSGLRAGRAPRPRSPNPGEPAPGRELWPAATWDTACPLRT